MTVKVRQMTSNRSGRPVANQFVIYTDEGTYFQSYNSVIALRDNNGKITLDDYYWDYSRTTSKYRNEFLGEGIEDTRVKIKSGEYKLADLNYFQTNGFMQEQDLIDLGFKRTDVSAEESGYEAFYYYDMDFGNKKVVSLISPSDDEVVDDEWHVTIFEDESLKIDKLNDLIDFINIMKRLCQI